MKKSILIVVLILSISCRKEATQPEVLGNHIPFDLEKTTFNENVPMLYSKHFINDYKYDMEKEYNPNEKLSDTIFRYRISNIVTETMKFKVPEKEFGFLYKSPDIDSIAKYQNVYFYALQSLTDLRKKPVAYYAEARFDSLKNRKQFLELLKKQYGEPKYAFMVSNEYNHCSYEWVLQDRTIQIETSYGWEFTASTDGSSGNSKYYRLDMLILSNPAKKAIEDAHILTVPDQIEYNGKQYSYEDFQFAKTSKLSDNFLLYSTYSDFINDELELHNINRAQEEE